MAVVIFLSVNTLLHSLKARLVVRSRLVPLAEQVKLQGASAFGKRQIAQFAQDHRIDIDQPNGKLPGFVCRFLLLQFVDQTHHCVETYSLAPAPGIASQGYGQVGLTRPGSADQQQIALLFQEVIHTYSLFNCPCQVRL